MLQSTSEYEERNFDDIQRALDIEHTVKALESQLCYDQHSPEEVARQILKAACKFYDADWCGLRNNSKNAHQLQAGGHSLTCTVLQAVALSCSQPFCAQVQKPYLECVQRNLCHVSSLSHTCNGTAL